MTCNSSNRQSITTLWSSRTKSTIKIFLEMILVIKRIIYEVCPEGIQPCTLKNRDIYWRRYKIQETLYIRQWCLSPFQSMHLGTSHSSPNIHQLPCHIFLNFTDGLKPLCFQRWSEFGKNQKSQAAKSGLLGGWVTLVIWCFTKKLCTRRDAWVGTLLWQSCQSPVTHSCGLLNHANSLCRGMFKLNAKLDADVLLHSLSHFECGSHTVHMLTQWRLPPPLTSTVKSSLFTHAHSSPLSLAARLYWCHTNHSHYINNGWTFWTSHC